MAGINWEEMPVWPSKVAAKFLGLRRGRMLGYIRGTTDLPEGAPPLLGEQDAGNRWYVDAASAKELKAFMEANPDAFRSGGGRLPPGVSRYKLYCTDAQADEIHNLYPDVRIEKAYRKRKKKAAEAEAESAK